MEENSSMAMSFMALFIFFEGDLNLCAQFAIFLTSSVQHCSYQNDVLIGK